MDINDIRSLVTLAGLLLFLALVAWTWWPARADAHDAAAQLPFAGDGDASSSDEAAARSPEAARTGLGAAGARAHNGEMQ
jgi:cytochrome c oxidase cbb3-type subunit 4